MTDSFVRQSPAFAPSPGDPQLTHMAVPPRGQPEDTHVPRRPAKDQPFLVDGDWLMVENLDSHPIEFAWARRKWVVAVGKAQPVLFEAVVNKLGDPRSAEDGITAFDDGNGNRGVIPRRYDELTRLMALYGVREERIEDYIHPETKEIVKGLLSLAPRVSVTTMEGRPITFPCQRHDMLPYPTRDLNPTRVNSDVSRMVDSVTAENAELRERVADLERLVNDRLGAASTQPEE